MADVNFILLSVGIIGLAVTVFLLLRSFVWWYFGISRHLENQERIIKLLSERRNVSKPVISRADVPFGQSQNR